MSTKALIVDDEVDLCRLMQITLLKMGLQSDVVYNLEDAYTHLEKNSYVFCLTDMRLPDGCGLDLVKYVAKRNWNLPIAMITAHGNMDIAIEALKLGAFDFVNKPLELPRLRLLVENALKVSKEVEELSQTATQTEKKSPVQQLLDERLIGESDAMSKLKNTIVKLARSQAPVFLYGASGTGKEVVARLIHDLSPRREGNFVPVNCGAIPSELMESEFFGHKKGSFTGATTDKQGLFQQANGGTLFLDEVADLPLAMQVKLLRAIQEKTVRAIGDTKEIAVDIRILSATHKDLQQLVQAGQFRQDLFYRINVIQLDLPTLNQRMTDIPMLAKHFLTLISAEWQLEEEISISSDALQLLTQHNFAGNVRELRNILERSVTMAESNIIDANHLMPISSNNQIQQTQQAHASSTGTLTNETVTSVENASQNAKQTATQTSIAQTNISSATSISYRSFSANAASTSQHRSSDSVSNQILNNSGVATISAQKEQTVITQFNHQSQTINAATINTSDMNSFFDELCASLTSDIETDTGLPISNLEEFLQKQEKTMITNALKHTNCNKTKTAKLLGMSLRSLRYRMDKLNIDSNEQG